MPIIDKIAAAAVSIMAIAIILVTPAIMRYATKIEEAKRNDTK